MTGDELRDHCLELLGAGEEFPFSAGLSVFKVGGKIFALSHLEDEPLQVSLKIDPVIGEQLRASCDAVKPGYHLNKKHWVTITVGGDADDELIRGLIEDSHDLVRPQPKRRRKSADRRLRDAQPYGCARVGVVKLLVLGGSGFVGRAVVEDALARDWAVTTFNRGLRAAADPRAEHVIGDRHVARDLAPLESREWDLVVDTWSGAPRAVRDSARLLSERAGRYAYVSSVSVYTPPPPRGGDESAPTVDADADAEDGDYPQLKRGAELAVEAAFGDRALLARAGLILGPHEDVGRLPWWLARMARGGDVLAPGPPELALQYVDARDLAAWLLDAAVAGRSGAFNVVSRTGHTTMSSLLEACRDVAGPGASLVWVDPDVVLEAGVEPWEELPIWLPESHEYRGLHEAAVGRVHEAGLRCRPVQETVSDTWAWLVSIGGAARQRADRPAVGLDPARERAVLDAWRQRSVS